MAADMGLDSPREKNINDSLSAISLQKEFIEKTEAETLIMVQAKERGEQLKHQKIKLNQVLGHYSDLKRKVISKRTLVSVLEALASEDVPEGIAVEPELMKQSTQQVRDAKEALSDNISRLNDKLDMAEELYNMFETRRKDLSTELEHAMAKKAEVEEYLETTDDVENADQGNKILEKVQSAIQATVSELSDSEVEMENLKTYIEKLKSSLNRSKTRKVKLENEIAKEKDLVQNLTTWFQERCTSIRNMSGIESCNIEDDTIYLALSGISGSPHQGISNKKLHLAVKFEYSTNGPILISAEVDENTLDVEEIIETAMERNDFAYLLSEIKRSWTFHMPLLTEVDQLRERFAVDWIHSENKLRMLCGENAHIICTLKISDKYPDQGSISLISLEGLKDGTSLNEIKPLGNHPSLTQWIEYLQQRFEGAKSA